MSDYILSEVVTEILKRLPVKSLLRFKCVCRDWCSLISNPSFISQHLSSSSSSSRSRTTLVRRFSNKEIYTLFHHDDEDTFNVENSSNIIFPFHDNAKHYYYHIVGYCNGVLCLSDDLFRLREENSFVLWNPSVRRALILPNPDFYRCGENENPILALGFGFDCKNDDYKVVRLAYFLNDCRSCHRLPPVVEVFSLSIGTWKRLNSDDVECYVSDHCWSQAFVCGAIHWVAFKIIKNDRNTKCHRNTLLKFDLSSEKFVELGLPEDLAGLPPIKMVATTVRGRLSVVYNDICVDISLWNDISGSCCAIWVMREYNDVKSWSLVFKVKSDLDLYRVLDVKKSGIMFAGRDQLSFYKFQNKVATSTGNFGTTNSFFMDKYVESLVLVSHGKQVSVTEPEFDYDGICDSDQGDEGRILGNKTNQFHSLYLTRLLRRDTHCSSGTRAVGPTATQA